MIAPFPSTIFPCTVHCFPLQHVRTLSSRASCDSRPSSVLTHQHSAHEPTALCASDRASLDASSEARPPSLPNTAQHSAHEPTALCASDRASLDVSSAARPPPLPNTRRTSLRLCAPRIELRSMRRAELDHPHCPSLGARAYGSVRLWSTLPEISSLPFPRRERCFLSTFVLFI